MWKNNLEYRYTLNTNNNITFGIEIEFEKARKSIIKDELSKAYEDEAILWPWKVVNDETLYDGDIVYSPRGGEAVSDVLKDNSMSWNDIEFVCNKIKKYGGIVTSRCGAHVHVGADIFKNKVLYYERLLKLWVIYEDVIMRFCCGEDNKPREYIDVFAASPYFLIKDLFDCYYDVNKRKLNISFEEFVNSINVSLGQKNLALSLKGLDEHYLRFKYSYTGDWDKHRTMEFRAGNSTLDPVIWQNYINLYLKMILCCLDENKDWDIIDKKFDDAIKRKKMARYNYNKAREFSEFVFNNDIDKYYFMLQYVKDRDSKNNKMKIRKR